MQISIIQRETRATAVSLGFPIPVTRADKDWPALALVASLLQPTPFQQQLSLPATARIARAQLWRLCLYRVFPARHIPVHARSQSGTIIADLQIWIGP